MRHHRTALLRQPGLVETRRRLLVEKSRGVEELVDRHDSGATDTNGDHRRGVGDSRLRRNVSGDSDGLVHRRISRGLGIDGDLDEGRAVAAEAGEIEVA